jgi:hypothetical protein
MNQGLGTPKENNDHQKALEVMYGKVAAQHDKIDDFRAKLLGFLPVVTGIGLFALVTDSSNNPEITLAIGIFGALASIGLFVHELRGITECYMLIKIGCKLEQKLCVRMQHDALYGPFSSRSIWGFRCGVSRETAAVIVYPVTIAAWIFLAVQQLFQPPLKSLLEPWLDGWNPLGLSSIVSFIVAIMAFLMALWYLKRADSKVDDIINEQQQQKKSLQCTTPSQSDNKTCPPQQSR